MPNPPLISTSDALALNPAKQDIHDLAFINSHHVTMLFLPQAWTSAPEIHCEWVDVSFPPDPRSAIPKKPGVYVFVVVPDLFSFQHASGLFYVGKATNLYQRIGAYTREIGLHFPETTRPLIWGMVNKWHGHLRYFYTTTDDAAIAAQLEDHLLTAFRPPFNSAYNATISKTMRAF